MEGNCIQFVLSTGRHICHSLLGRISVASHFRRLVTLHVVLNGCLDKALNYFEKIGAYDVTLRLKASMRQVSFNTALLPTERTSIPTIRSALNTFTHMSTIPSVLLPTDSSGWLRTPFSMISAMCRRAGPYCFCQIPLSYINHRI